MTDLPAGHAEARISVPLRLLLISVVSAILVVAGGWYAMVTIGPWGQAELRAGLWGIGAAGAVAVLGVLVMMPWKSRAIADWMTTWLGATVFRLFVTPAAAFLLYFAFSPGLAAKPLGLSVAVTYLLALLVEAAVIARYVNDLLRR